MVKIFILSVTLFCCGCSKSQDYLISNFGHIAPLPAPPAPPDTAFVLVIWGQSNAAGRVNVVNVDTSWMLDDIIYSGDTAWTRNWNGTADQDAGWEVLEGGVSTGDQANRVGMQPMLAKRYLQHKGKNVYVIQATQGNTSIINWTGGAAYDLYNYCDTIFSSVRNYLEGQGKYVKFVASVFYQGESNCVTTDTTQYKAELDDLLALSRTWTETPNLPFIEVQLLDCQTTVSCLANMQSAQQTWAWTNSENNVYLLPKTVGPNACIPGDVVHADFQQLCVSMPEWIFQLIKDW